MDDKEAREILSRHVHLQDRYIEAIEDENVEWRTKADTCQRAYELSQDRVAKLCRFIAETFQLDRDEVDGEALMEGEWIEGAFNRAKVLLEGTASPSETAPEPSGSPNPHQDTKCVFPGCEAGFSYAGYEVHIEYEHDDHAGEPCDRNVPWCHPFRSYDESQKAEVGVVLPHRPSSLVTSQKGEGP